MNKRRNDISKAEQQANQIIAQAELRKQRYLQEAHDLGMKQVKEKELILVDEFAQKKYDLSSE